MTMKEHLTLLIIDITSGFTLNRMTISADRAGEVIETRGFAFKVS
jgi:hypothetical protein